MKIISGGQTGADQAGLQAAYDNDIETGGYAPTGFMTLEGRNYMLRDVFDLVAVKGGYKKRTYMNVLHSDCTLRFAYDFTTAGEKCTLNAIGMYEKPYKDTPLNYPIHPSVIREIGIWILENGFQTINIAGNAQHELDVFTPVYFAVCDIINFVRKNG